LQEKIKTSVDILHCISFKYTIIFHILGGVVVVIVWQLDLQLPVQSVPITSKVR